MSGLSQANRRTVLVVAALVVAVVAVNLVALTVLRPAKMMTITAQFAEAPGIYSGNHVDVLGMPIGNVTSVKPGPGYATVTMSVKASVPLPANVIARLDAPQVVSDRYVALTPVYRSGPKLPPGAVIPISRTAIPVSVDQIIDQTDMLVKALGPTGANKNGALSATLKQLAQTLGGQGPNINATITGFGATLGGLQNYAPDVTNLLNNLGQFTTAAAQDTNGFSAFANDLAAVSTQLAGDDKDIGGALHNLQTALAQVATFVQNNRDAIGATSTNLQVFANTLANEQSQLAQVLTTGPLALGNFANAVDTGAPGGPAVRTRLDTSPATHALSGQVCGSFANGTGVESALLRALLVTVGEKPEGGATALKPYSPLDLVCAFTAALQSLGTPPGASTGPNLSLNALVGG